jgi:hypothetical protein
MPENLPMPRGFPPSGNMLIYQDGATRLQVRLDGQTVWLPQRLIAELFQITVPTANEHLANIYDERELDPTATIRKFRIVQIEGSRQDLPTHRPLQFGRHPRGRLPRSLSDRHAVSTMGDGSAQRTAREGLHAR